MPLIELSKKTLKSIANNIIKNICEEMKVFIRTSQEVVCI